MCNGSLKANIERTLEAVERAASRAGSKVTVVAATKTVPPELINECIALGLTDVGENRVQEYVAKRELVSGARWHFIGTLQRNKVKYLAGSVALIQSVASSATAREADRLAGERGVVQDILLEFNPSDDPNKTGAPLSAASELIEYTRQLKNIRLRGLMAVPARDAEDGAYIRMRELFDKYRGGVFDTLSMGMSGDFERAILLGSNMVRIGTAIFGQRKQ